MKRKQIAIKTLVLFFMIASFLNTYSQATAPIQAGSPGPPYNGALYHFNRIGIRTTIPKADIDIKTSYPLNQSGVFLKLDRLESGYQFKTKFIFKYNGNMGIGTANPLSKFHIDKGNLTITEGSILIGTSYYGMGLGTNQIR